MTCVYHYHTPREREEKIAEYCSTDPKQINEKSSEYGSRENKKIEFNEIFIIASS